MTFIDPNYTTLVEFSEGLNIFGSIFLKFAFVFFSCFMLPIAINCRLWLTHFGRYIPIGWTILKIIGWTILKKVRDDDPLKYLWWRYRLLRMPSWDEKAKKERRLREEAKKKNADFGKWVAYAYILGFSALCFYLVLRSNVGPDTNDFEYHVEYVLRSGSSAMDYIIYFGPYYGWEWDPSSKTYIPVEVFGVDYDSDIDPDITSFKPHKAETEEEEAYVLVPEDLQNIGVSAEEDS